MKPSERPHYVNNRDFSNAVVDYVTEANEAIDAEEDVPVVPNYIAECFLKICEGLSRKSNFVRYSYREEMVMDAVENCLKAIKNYNVENATRSGKPNAFGYFTQIAWFAFIRRIQKEKKVQDAKLRFIAESSLDEFMVDADEDPQVAKHVQSFIDNLRRRIDDVKDKDQKFDTYQKKKKMTNKRVVIADSDLSDFLGD